MSSFNMAESSPLAESQEKALVQAAREVVSRHHLRDFAIATPQWTFTSPLGISFSSLISIAVNERHLTFKISEIQQDQKVSSITFTCGSEFPLAISIVGTRGNYEAIKTMLDKARDENLGLRPATEAGSTVALGPSERIPFNCEEYIYADGLKGFRPYGVG